MTFTRVDKPGNYGYDVLYKCDKCDYHYTDSADATFKENAIRQQHDCPVLVEAKT